MSDEIKKEEACPAEDKPSSSTPTYVRVLALLGALTVIGISIAYAYSLATGSLFWM